MTRSDLVEELAARFSQLTHRDAEHAVKTILDAVGDALVRGHRVEIRGFGEYNLLKGLNHATLDPELVPLRLDDPRLAVAAKRDPHVRAFLFWSRMPMVTVEGSHAYLTDQRFFDAGRAPSSTFLIPLDNRWPSS